MLDVRHVECTTALEVRLLAELTAARKEISRLRPKPPRTKPKFKPAERKLEPPAEVYGPPAPDPLGRVPAFQADIKRIQLAVAKRFDITRDDLLSHFRRFATPRHVAVMLCYVLTNRSYPHIGRHFGGRDHTTALNSVCVMDGVRRKLVDELSAGDFLDRWVERSYELVCAERAKGPQPVETVDFVVDIKAERAEYAQAETPKV